VLKIYCKFSVQKENITITNVIKEQKTVQAELPQNRKSEQDTPEKLEYHFSFNGTHHAWSPSSKAS
jgi:hypothetical protein